MRHTSARPFLRVLMSLLLVLFTTTAAFAQCNWATYSSLGYPASHVSLTSFQNKLYLSWISLEYNVKKLYVSTSLTGTSWTTPLLIMSCTGQYGQTCFDMTYSGGLGMTSSEVCGQVYLGWNDNYSRMWASRSTTGTSWSAPTFISNNAESAPELRGDDPTLPIGWAFSSWWNPANAWQVLTGKFDCNFGNVTFIDCLLASGLDTCDYWGLGQDAPMKSVWTGAGGIEFRAEARGQYHADPPWTGFQDMHYRITPGWQLGNTNWSNNGVAGTVDPSTGKAYLAWTCHDGGGDNCSDPGGPPVTSKIRLWNSDGFAFTCTGLYEYSVFNPAMTFFQGKLWVAWSTGGPTVASMVPF